MNNKWLFLVATLMLWLNFSGHLLTTLPLKKFIDAEFQSERFVFSRLVYNLEHGKEAQGGLMLRYLSADQLYKSVERYDYADFKEGISDSSEIEVYSSHAALQDNLVFPLWQGLEKLKVIILANAREGSRWQQRLQTLDWYYYNLISQTLVALVNAITLGLFILWVGRTFSPKQGWIVLAALLILSPVLTFFGRSLWWMMWSWFLPMVITLWGLALHKGTPPKAMASLCMGIAMGGAVFVKTAMGYEFVSTIMTAALVPVVFYAIYQSWGFKKWFITSAILGAFCLIGFLSAFAFHWHVLEKAGLDPAQVIQGRYEARAHGGDTLRDTGEIYRSTQASFLSVLGGYLISPKELSVPQILLMFPFLWWLIGYLKTGRRAILAEERRLWDALASSIGVSFIGGASMLFILKGHAYIHGFDIVIWMIPLNLFLFTFYALRLSNWRQG